MKAIIILAFAAISVAVLTSAQSTASYPLLMTTSTELSQLSKSLTTSEEISRKTVEAFASKSALPEKIVVYEISTSLAPQEVSKFIQRRKNEFPRLLELFANTAKSFTSFYLRDNTFSKAFTTELESRGSSVSGAFSALSEANFAGSHAAALANEGKTVEVVAVEFASLLSLDQQIASDVELLNKLGKSYVIVISFNQASNGDGFDFASQKFIQKKSGRILEGEAAGKVVAPTPDVPGPIGISGNILSGYLIFLTCAIVILFGVLSLYSIQTPTKFPSAPFVVGRES